MDKKIKHRILGVLVIAALVVILIPFFHGKNEFSTDAPSVKAPPFPGQTVQAVNPEFAMDAAPAVQQPVIPIVNTSSDEIRDKPDDTISNTHVSYQPEVSNQSDPGISPAKTKPAAVKEATAESRPRVAELKPRIKTPVSQARAAAAQSQTPSAIPALTSGDNGLIVLKSSVWVIQLGSYKNKTKALRLVNQLRAGGYPAFIQKISTAFGESTQVYVGPTAKRSAAHELADRLEAEMHIHGIVISYKPLTL